MDATTEKQVWASHLRQCLIKGGGLTSETVRALVRRFDAAASTPEQCEPVFRAIMEQFGNMNVDVACAGVTEEIHRALEQANRQTIDRNPVTRLAGRLARGQSPVKKCEVEVSGVDLDKFDKSKLSGSNVKITVPVWARQQPTTFCATAKYRGQEIPFQIEAR